MQYPALEVVVWGERACFTRPEMKVERVSYPVMTPSAARGILEAIYWKPEVYYQILEIWSLKKVEWFSIKRNEVSGKGSYSAAQDGKVIIADDPDRYRTQRATLGLREVRYLIKADIYQREHDDKDIAGHRAIFHRRVEKGACFHQPSLGCREFSADFAPPDGSEKPIEATEDLGRMLFDIDFDPRKDGKTGPAPGTGIPIFFSARLEKGILHIPQEYYQQLRWSRKESK